MFAQDHLTLRLVRLKSSQEWSPEHEGVCLVFPTGGGARHAAGKNGSVLQIEAGDVLLLSQHAPGRLQVGQRGEFIFWCFTFSVEHLFPLFASEEIALLQSVVEGLKGAKLYPAAGAASIECHRLIQSAPPQVNLEHRSHLLRIASVVLANEFNAVRRQRVGFVRADEHLMQVFETLSAEELLTLSVTELAKKFGCSRRHLTRLFHQYFGLSVGALRMEMRLIKAIALLRDPDAKIINVAERCGFNHLGLFNTCFRKRFGVSPGQWRKTAGQAGNGEGALPAEHPGCPLHANGLCPWSGHPLDQIPAAPKSASIGGPEPAQVFPNLFHANPPPQAQATSVDVERGILAGSSQITSVQA